MKLLFITQKVDKNDDVLGVYHRWIEELASRFEKVSVICLYRGRVELPANVSVYSLGKESGAGRLRYLARFYYLIISLLPQYDKVFIHMNPEYLILAGWLWKLTGKKAILWYAHYLATGKLRLAAWWADKIVTSTRLAYPLTDKKLEVLQQGIDTEKFRPTPRNKGGGKFKILFLGRIAPVKDLETLLNAFKEVYETKKDVFLTIVGGPTVGRLTEQVYYEKIKKLVEERGLSGVVAFRPAVSNDQTPAIYNDHDLFINLTITGSFDKSTLEAMACGLPVVVSNEAFSELFPEDLRDQLMFPEKNVEILAERITTLANLSPTARESIGLVLRGLVVAKHGLNDLMDRLAKAIESV